MPEKFSQQIQTKQQLIPQKNKHATQYNLESANLTKNTLTHTAKQSSIYQTIMKSSALYYIECACESNS